MTPPRHRLPARFHPPTASSVSPLPPALPVDESHVWALDPAAGDELLAAADRHTAATPGELLAGAVRAELLADDWRSATLATRPAGDDDDAAPAGWGDDVDGPIVALVPGPAFDRATLDELLDGRVDDQVDDDECESPGEHARAVAHAAGDWNWQARGHGWTSGPVDDDDQVDGAVDIRRRDGQPFGSGWDSESVAADLDAALAVAVDDAQGDDVDDELEAPAPEDLRRARLEQLVPAGNPPVYGWAPRHDDRSLEYAVAAELAHRAPLQDRVYLAGPVLDQAVTDDDLPPERRGACGGYAAVAARNAAAGPAGGPYLDDDDAADLYLDAQRHDHLSGESYAGTSVLAVMEAGRRKGLWDAYLWAFGVRDVGQAILQVGPVVIGVPWFAGMETTDADGIVTVTGDPVGGHAIAVVGIVLTRAGRPGPWFVLQNSRGTSWGDDGLGYLHVDDLRALLAGRGEAAIPVRRPA